MNLSEQIKRGFEYNNLLKEGELLFAWKNPFTNYFPEVIKENKELVKSPIDSADPPITPIKDNKYWISQAQKANNDIKTINDIKAWLAKLGVTVDGKWGPLTLKAYEKYRKDMNAKSQSMEKYVRKLRNNSTSNKNNPTTSTPSSDIQISTEPVEENSYKRYDPPGIGDFWISNTGNIYHVPWGGKGLDLLLILKLGIKIPVMLEHIGLLYNIIKTMKMIIVNQRLSLDLIKEEK